MLPLQGAQWVPSLFRELRFPMPPGTAKVGIKGRGRFDIEKKNAMLPVRQRLEQCVHKSRIVNSYQELEEERGKFPSRASGGSVIPPTL